MSDKKSAKKTTPKKTKKSPMHSGRKTKKKAGAERDIINDADRSLINEWLKENKVTKKV